LQPGQPTFSEWSIDNSDASQPFSFVLTVLGKDGSIRNPWIEIGGYHKLELAAELAAGHSLVCDGEKLKLYNEKGNFDKEPPSPKSIPALTAGSNALKFDCEFPNNDSLKIRLVVKCISKPEVIGGSKK